MRLFAISLAAAATSVLSGCGSTHYYSAEEVRELGALRRAAEPRAAAPIRTVGGHTPESVGVRSSENSAHRPWPEVGSAEAQEIVAQQDVREKRIQEMVHGIC